MSPIASLKIERGKVLIEQLNGIAAFVTFHKTIATETKNGFGQGEYEFTHSCMIISTMTLPLKLLNFSSQRMSSTMVHTENGFNQRMKAIICISRQNRLNFTLMRTIETRLTFHSVKIGMCRLRTLSNWELDTQSS